jgi:Flp pilus assembly protein protease CpaA
MSPAPWPMPVSFSIWKPKPAEKLLVWIGARRRACGSMSYLAEIKIALHALTATLVIWGGCQDWQRREVADWLTWPLFVMGLGAAIYRAVHLDFVPLSISIFVLSAWYFNWLGGADARVLVGLWGLWPIAGLTGIVCTGIWGLTLLLLKRGSKPIPALVTIAVGVIIQLIPELFRL